MKLQVEVLGKLSAKLDNHETRLEQQKQGDDHEVRLKKVETHEKEANACGDDLEVRVKKLEKLLEQRQVLLAPPEERAPFAPAPTPSKANARGAREPNGWRRLSGPESKLLPHVAFERLEQWSYTPTASVAHSVPRVLHTIYDSSHLISSSSPALFSLVSYACLAACLPLPLLVLIFAISL